MRLISGLIDCAYTCSYAVLEHSNTNTKTSHIWTKSINAFTQLSKILNGTKDVIVRQCCSIIGKQIKLHVICLLWKSALVGGCFSLDLGQLIVVDSQNMKTFWCHPSSTWSVDTSSKLWDSRTKLFLRFGPRISWR